jgi:PAS domain S-box-containing protein
MLGHDPATFRETNAAWLERLHPDDRERVTATFGDYVAGRLPVYQVEFRQRTASGGWRWILSLGKIVERDGQGRPVRMLGTHTDITERKLAEESLRQATLVVENSPVVLFRWKAAEGWPVELASRNVRQFGYTADELMSGAVPFAALVHPEDIGRVVREVQEHGAAGSDRFRQEYRLLTRAGEVRWVDDRTVVERDAEGRIAFYQGIVIDITERKQAEQSLRTSLAEKTALLQEVHHRVKNNLQVVSSLLSLQAGLEKNRSAVDALRETQGRIRSMALLHEMLYRSEGLARVDFGGYLDRLCAHLLRAVGHHAGRVTLERRGGAVELGLDQAVPCGLIVSELVSNALKHAFPEDRAGRIVIDVSRSDALHLSLIVADDGVGLPPDPGATGTSTLGLRLVRILAAQLKGTLTEVPRPGASFRIVFPREPTTPP